MDEDGKTALHWAVCQGHAEATILLLERNADPNALDNVGLCYDRAWIEPMCRSTPILHAAQNGNLKCAKVSDNLHGSSSVTIGTA